MLYRYFATTILVALVVAGSTVGGLAEPVLLSCDMIDPGTPSPISRPQLSIGIEVDVSARKLKILWGNDNDGITDGVAFQSGPEQVVPKFEITETTMIVRIFAKNNQNAVIFNLDRVTGLLTLGPNSAKYKCAKTQKVL